MLYRTLSVQNREIRLLSIAVEGSDSDRVVCRLNEYSLLEAPPYTALSYTWGSPKAPRTSISVNGRPFQITVNLLEALRQLHRSGYTTVWADAICINQDDFEERSVQVMLMRNIYFRASQVVVWLGTGDSKTKDAIQEIDSFIYDMNQSSSDESSSSDDEEGSSSHGKQDKKEKDNSEALYAFFDRPYWRRVWIIQEIVSASNVIVYCGENSIEMEYVEHFLEKTPTGKKIVQRGYVPRFDHFRKDPITDIQRPLVTLLLSSHTSLATDPRDKIYALLGLSLDGPDIVDLPNYRKPYEHVFEEVVLAMIKKGYPSLMTLTSTNRLEHHGMPSWVPDFTVISQSLRPWHHWLLRRDSPEVKSNERLRRHPIESQNGVLKVRGYVHDCIDGISTRVREHGSPSRAIGLRRTMSEPQYQANAYENAHETTLAIASSLCMDGLDIGTDDMQAPRLRSSAYLCSLHDLRVRGWLSAIANSSLRPMLQDCVQEWLHLNKMFESGGHTLQEWIDTSWKGDEDQGVKDLSVGHFLSLVRPLKENSSDCGDHELFAHRVNQVLGHGMRLVTSQQGFIGVAHPHAQPGDKICTILGCALPVILRKQGDTFRVIGEAYLYPIARFGCIAEDDWRLEDILLS